MRCAALENDLEALFDAQLLALSRFEDGIAWRLDVLTDGPPDPAMLQRLDAYLFEDDVLQPPAALPDEDWVARVQRDMPPISAGRFWVHGSHVAESPPAGSIALRVEGTSAFGTGHHGSTMGCLLALDGLAKRAQPRRVLDIGTGTGILAVAAARRWRVSVVASDNDPEAVRVAQRTARANRVGDLIRCVLADGPNGRAVLSAAPYDLVVANILATPLAKMASQVARRSAHGGHLVLSGILDRQAAAVVAAYRATGFALSNTVALGEWVTLQLVRL